jgi:hypothetical protein
VYNLYSQVVNAGNYNWTDDSGDGIQEPLLDVNSFHPVLVETGGGVPGGVSLSVKIVKVTGVKYADLTWSGASTAEVDVYKGSSFLTTTANDGAYRDGPLPKSGSATYKVCEAGTNVCSADVTVNW